MTAPVLGDLTAWELNCLIAVKVKSKIRVGRLTNIHHTDNLGYTGLQTFVSIEGDGARWSGHLPSTTECTLLDPEKPIQPQIDSKAVRSPALLGE